MKLDSPIAFGDLRREAPSALRWIESLLLTAALPGLRWGFADRDPFGVGDGFPWLVLVPLIVAVQHGLLASLASAVCLCGGAWVYAAASGQALPPAAPAVGFACLVIASIAGRARDARYERCDRLARHTRALMAALARERDARQVLQLSHERLAERIEGPARSLGSCVEGAARRAPHLQRGSEVGRLILDLLAQHAELLRGAVFVLEPGRRTLVPAPLAVLDDRCDASSGGGADSARVWAGVASDPVVTRALRARRLVLITDVEAALAGPGDVLAALPLLAADAALLGVVVISELPFAAFHPDALRRAQACVSRVAGAVDSRVWAGWISAWCGGSALPSGSERCAS